MLFNLIIILTILIIFLVIVKKSIIPYFGNRIKIIIGNKVSYKSKDSCDVFLNRVKISVINIYKGVNKNKEYETVNYLDIFNKMDRELKKSRENMYYYDTRLKELNMAKEFIALQNRNDADIGFILNRNNNLSRLDLDKIDISNNVVIPDNLIISILTSLDLLIYMLRNSIKIDYIDLTSTKLIYKKYRIDNSSKNKESCIGYFSKTNTSYNIDRDLAAQELHPYNINLNDNNYEKDMLNYIRPVGKKNKSQSTSSIFTCDNSFNVENEKYSSDMVTPIQYNLKFDHKSYYNPHNLSKNITNMNKYDMLFEESRVSDINFRHVYKDITNNINKYSLTEEAPYDPRYS